MSPQLIPTGLDVTVPTPEPSRVTTRPNTVLPNVAVTVFATFMVTLQVVPVPEHAPDQPSNVAPESGVAVSVTTEPSVKVAVQAEPQ